MKDSGDYDYFRHVNTFGGSPAACAVALKNIEIMQEENLFDRSRVKGAEILEKLGAALKDEPIVGDVRGKGLLIGIELVSDKKSKSPLDVKIVNEVIAACKAKGVIINKNGATVAGFNNVLTLAPPLNISDKDIDIVIQTVVDAIKNIN